jgi:hypothetical protein
VSSGGGFTVQPTDLGTNGSQYSAVADQVRQIHQTLVDKLNAEGACWGNDEAGAQFAKTYVPPAMTALGQMNDVDGGVQSMSEAAQSWAKNYQAVNTA